MNHWIITNRQVIKKNGKEVVKEDEHEPLPSFRIAKFNVPGNLDGPDEDFYSGVDFIADKMDSMYGSPKEDSDPNNLKGTAQMFLDIYQSMCNAGSNKGDTLFFIHGFNYSWLDALKHLTKLHQLYVEAEDSPISQIVYFSWPSFGDVLKYKSDQPNALNSGTALGRLFRKVGEFYSAAFARKTPLTFCERKLHLGAHSMGNQVLDSFCKVINGFGGTHINLFSEVVLLNADADWDVLSPDRDMASLNEYSDRIHVYSNYHDQALWASETTKNREKRLGRHGPKDMSLIPARTIVLDATGEPRPLDIQNTINDVFASHANNIMGIKGDVGDGAREPIAHHWGYLYRNDVISDLKAVFRGEGAAQINNRQLKANNLFTFVKG